MNPTLVIENVIQILKYKAEEKYNLLIEKIETTPNIENIEEIYNELDSLKKKSIRLTTEDIENVKI